MLSGNNYSSDLAWALTTIFNFRWNVKRAIDNAGQEDFGSFKLWDIQAINTLAAELGAPCPHPGFNVQIPGTTAEAFGPKYKPPWTPAELAGIAADASAQYDPKTNIPAATGVCGPPWDRTSGNASYVASNGRHTLLTYLCCCPGAALPLAAEAHTPSNLGHQATPGPATTSNAASQQASGTGNGWAPTCFCLSCWHVTDTCGNIQANCHVTAGRSNVHTGLVLVRTWYCAIINRFNFRKEDDFPRFLVHIRRGESYKGNAQVRTSRG